MAAIREQQVLRRFPGATATDLYVMITSQLVEMAALTTQLVTPDAAVLILSQEGRSPLYRTVSHLIGRLSHALGRPESY